MTDSERSDDQTDSTERTRLRETNLTRRDTLRAGAMTSVGLALGGMISESTVASTPQTAQNDGSTKDSNTIPVTWANYPRANGHAAFRSTVDKGGFGRLYHFRSLSPIDEQIAIEENRDTLYSFGVFDLTEPVTITKPDTGDRYQSMNVQNEEQYGKMCVYEPGQYTITREMVDSRYAGVAIRTFVDPDNTDDLKRVRKLQDEIAVEQASTGSFEIPNWDQQSFEEINNALKTVMLTVDNLSGAFGDVGEVDPVKFFIASTSGWTGVPEPSEAVFLTETPAQNDGTTPYTLTVKDVPVDGFWSVTAYNRDLYLEKNKYDAYSVNNVTAERNDDGSVTIHFGGDPTQSNFLYTPEGWHYVVRLYKPRESIIDGSYQFPEAQPVP